MRNLAFVLLILSFLGFLFVSMCVPRRHENRALVCLVVTGILMLGYGYEIGVAR